MSTEELLVSVAHGDERAFEIFYDRLVGPMLGLARTVVRDAAQAEEVVQEVFVQLWRTAARFHPERGRAQTWAMTIAHRRAVDWVRSAQARVDRERVASVRDYPGGEYDRVVDQVLTNLDHGEVRSCLRRLTDLERESIVLAYYQALTYREVADTLNVASGTAKSRIHAGLRRLRDCLTHDHSHH